MAFDPRPRLRGRRLALIGLFLFSATAVLRAETFDLATFASPPGARNELAEAVSFADTTPTTFAIYGVYKSAPGSGDPARDFADEWALLVDSNARVTSELKTETIDWPGGWKLTMGAAKAWSERSRSFVALLNVFTGYGVKVSVLVNYNDDLYRPKIDKFIASLRLTPPAVAAASAPLAQVPPNGAHSGTAAALTSNEWYRSTASTWQGDGYLRYRYRFGADGAYTFVKEWWSQYHHTDYWFIEESGRYQVEGSALHLTPAKAVKSLRDRVGQTKGKPEGVALEQATYRYRFEQLYKPTLILTPTSGRPTERDGKAFSSAGDGKSYYYEPPSRCEQRPAPADCP